MKSIIIAILLFPSIAFALEFGDDGQGNTESKCFNVKNGDKIKATVSCPYNFTCYYSIFVKFCSNDKFTGSNLSLQAKPFKTKSSTITLRKSGKVYIRALMGGPWSAKLIKARK